MADESSEPVAHATAAHECNGDREGLACNPLSDSGASISDGATEISSDVDEEEEESMRCSSPCCLLSRLACMRPYDVN